jgi:hypothetical protein
MSEVADAIGLLSKKLRDGERVPFVHAIVPDEKDAIRWIAGQGLYVEAICSGDPYDGERVRAAVGGSLYGSFGGRFHSDPLLPGEHVAIALVEGTLDGHAVVMSRVPVEDSKPPSTVAFRQVTEATLRKFLFEILPPGVGFSATLEGGSVYVRLIEKGSFTIQLPDGSVIDCQKNPVDGDYGIKLKSAKGAVVMVVGSGVFLGSPSKTSYIQVEDSGITLHGQIIRSEGTCLLGMDATSGDVPAAQGAAICPAGAPSTAVIGSKKVFIGK